MCGMRSAIICCLAILVLAGSIHAQQNDAKATVYVYSYSASVVGNLRSSIFVDDKDVADITPRRYFILKLDAGKHSVHLKKPTEGGLEMEFKAGQTYYIRVDWKEGGFTVRARGLDLIGAESGSYDISQSKPVQDNYLKDRTIAFNKP